MEIILALYGFMISIIIYIINFFTRKIPINPSGSFFYKTYTYKIIGKKQLKFDIWYPKPKKKKLYPLVFFAHGGGWVSGFRNQPNNISWCKFLASKGFAVVSIDYRFGFKNSMEDILKDYTDALEYVKQYSATLKIDANKIILMGLSAGAHLTMCYAAYNTAHNNSKNMKGILGVCSYYCPSNLNDLFLDDTHSLLAKFGITKAMKGSPEKEKDLYQRYSPIHFITKNMLPTLVVHGKKDVVVPIVSSENLVKELKSNNIPYKFLVHKTGGHTFEFILKDIQTIQILQNTIKFMKGLIKNEH